MRPGPHARQIRGACPLDCPDTCNWIVTVTVDERDAEMGGGAVYHDNRVRVDRIPREAI